MSSLTTLYDEPCGPHRQFLTKILSARRLKARVVEACRLGQQGSELVLHVQQFPVEVIEPDIRLAAPDGLEEALTEAFGRDAVVARLAGRLSQAEAFQPRPVAAVELTPPSAGDRPSAAGLSASVLGAASSL